MTTRVLPPLRLGPLTVDVPVVLAPVAGVTSAPFRRLCRDAGAGLAIAEMVTSRALVEHNPEAWHMASFEPDECPRSVQLYGVDPVTVGAAVRALVTADGVDHIDLNFGCPAPKVTRRGGGSALPWKTELYRAIVRAAVREATPSGVPVTVKLRTGIDDEHVTFLDAGRIARDEGVAAVILHARTTAQYYSGKADWSAIARLKQALPDLPVLGNGDVFSAEDGLAMVAQTGCDGVVVGRGCQGRPWVFADLAAAFTGSDERVRPSLGDVAGVVRRHAGLLARYFADERQACRDLRKHMA
ncbi:MAG: tRNA dihydrouridine synthase DusB, partial [Micrococcales bacterium]|nr:tRNA dihydrouridine synthase DusB [Micrococcales bacterium]